MTCLAYGILQNQWNMVVAIYNDDVGNDGNDGGNGILAWTTGVDMQLTFFAHEMGHGFRVERLVR